MTQNLENEHLTVHLSGYINENCPIFGVNLISVSELTIDLKDINYVNSIGIKNWIDWTHRLRPNLKINLINCPSLVVNQINMVDGFLPAQANVISFYVPYTCDDCSEEKKLLITNGIEFEFGTESTKARYDLPTPMICPKCGAEMELDYLVAKFFKFLTYTPPKEKSEE